MGFKLIREKFNRRKRAITKLITNLIKNANYEIKFPRKDKKFQKIIKTLK